jgi:hypothetical protein
MFHKIYLYIDYYVSRETSSSVFMVLVFLFHVKPYYYSAVFNYKRKLDCFKSDVGHWLSSFLGVDEGAGLAFFFFDVAKEFFDFP